VVETLRRLKGDGILTPQQAAMLPDAEAQLAKLSTP
jgi:hypothetical protein